MKQIERIVDTYHKIKEEINKHHSINDEEMLIEMADAEMERICLMLEYSNKPYFYNDRMFYAHCIGKLETELVKVHKGQEFLNIDVYRLLTKQLDFWQGRLAEFEKYERFD